MKTADTKRSILPLDVRKNSCKKIAAGIGLSLALHAGMFGQVSYCTNNCGRAGTDNASFGQNVLTNITTGSYNSGFAQWSLVNTTTGSENAAYGGSTLGYNTSGSRNTGLGYASLGNNTTASDNTSVGNRAAMNLTTGGQNTILGKEAFYSNQVGIGSTAVGYQALYSDTYNNGSHPNQAFGYQALKSNTTGQQNTALGYQVLLNSVGAHNLTGVGMWTLKSNTSGGDNTAMGCVALTNNTTGGDNTAYGVLALDGNVTGSGNTGIGRGASVGANNLTNAMALGNGAIVNVSNRTFIGNTTMTLTECVGGIYTVSDGRFKTNVSEDDVKGLAFIKLLRPVVYNFDTKKFQGTLTANLSDDMKAYAMKQDFEPSTAIRQTGFIAQEVEKAAKDAGFDFNGVNKPQNSDDHYSLSYAQFVVPLVKAVQEQQKMIEDLQKTIVDLNKTQSAVTGINQAEMLSQGFSMDQNQPNPFTHETTVKYTLPKEISSAYMGIYDLSGKQVTTLPLNTKENAVRFTSEKLAAGIYIYTIVADGKALDSKRMIVGEK
ncbi:MAG: tail fiber domain-containing protein [Bacteroidota bacterium]